MIAHDGDDDAADDDGQSERQIQPGQLSRLRTIYSLSGGKLGGVKMDLDANLIRSHFELRSSAR